MEIVPDASANVYGGPTMCWALFRCLWSLRDQKDNASCHLKAYILVGEAHKSKKCHKIQLL